MEELLSWPSKSFIPCGPGDTKKVELGKLAQMYQPGFRFICDYGRNIYAGDNVSVNMNCTFVDCSKITIGNHVLIVLYVRPYTATHPVELSERLTSNRNRETGPYFTVPTHYRSKWEAAAGYGQRLFRFIPIVLQTGIVYGFDISKIC